MCIRDSSNGLLKGQITKMGPTASETGAITITTSQIQSITENLQGDGSQWVWMDADSQQNSQSATIALQSL